jgi:hypothetical protein
MISVIPFAFLVSTAGAAYLGDGAVQAGKYKTLITDKKL